MRVLGVALKVSWDDLSRVDLSISDLTCRLYSLASHLQNITNAVSCLPRSFHLPTTCIMLDRIMADHCCDVAPSPSSRRSFYPNNALHLLLLMTRHLYCSPSYIVIQCTITYTFYISLNIIADHQTCKRQQTSSASSAPPRIHNWTTSSASTPEHTSTYQCHIAWTSPHSNANSMGITASPMDS